MAKPESSLTNQDVANIVRGFVALAGLFAAIAHPNGVIPHDDLPFVHTIGASVALGVLGRAGIKRIVKVWKKGKV